MENGKYVMRQMIPVKRNAGTPDTLSTFNWFPYNGHRFIGEYEELSVDDINPPILLFTGETPTQG